MKGCFKLGLIKQGLLHDLSKYGLTEFRVGAKYYKGYMSPNNAERMDKGYSSAWLHHKGRNRHHWAYWADEFSNGTIVHLMPKKDFVELVCDFLGAAHARQSALGFGKFIMAFTIIFMISSNVTIVVHIQTVRSIV